MPGSLFVERGTRMSAASSGKFRCAKMRPSPVLSATTPSLQASGSLHLSRCQPIPCTPTAYTHTTTSSSSSSCILRRVECSQVTCFSSEAFRNESAVGGRAESFTLAWCWRGRPRSDFNPLVLLMVERIRTYDRLLSIQHGHPASSILHVTGHYKQALGLRVYILDPRSPAVAKCGGIS